MGTTEDVELKKYSMYRTTKHPVKTAKCFIMHYAIYYMRKESFNNIYVLPQKPLTVNRCYVCVLLDNLIMCLHGSWFGLGLGDNITGSCSFMLKHSFIRDDLQKRNREDLHQRTLTAGWP